MKILGIELCHRMRPTGATDGTRTYIRTGATVEGCQVTYSCEHCGYMRADWLGGGDARVIEAEIKRRKVCT